MCKVVSHSTSLHRMAFRMRACAFCGGSGAVKVVSGVGLAIERENAFARILMNQLIAPCG